MKLLKSPYIIQMIKSMVTLFTTVKMRLNGGLHVPPPLYVSAHVSAPLLCTSSSSSKKADPSAAFHWVCHNDTVVVAMHGERADEVLVGGKRGKEWGDKWRARTEGCVPAAWRLSLMDDGPAMRGPIGRPLAVAVSNWGHPELWPRGCLSQHMYGC